MNQRRHFLQTLSALGGAMLFAAPLYSNSNAKKNSRIACQQYPWQTFFRREGKNWETDLGNSIQQLADSGFQGFEPSFTSPDAAQTLQPLLSQHQLQTYSLYVNSVLHDPELVAASTAEVLAIARAARSLGVKIIVTNPSPIRWGSGEDKTDTQLQTQAKALDALGRQLRTMGMTLAYHNHDAEMRNSAREFHHMMLGTDPKNVSLCLDAHWIYRGSGNSQVALFDIVELYVDRIVELHLRQSVDGIWTEEFKEGDIDYNRLAKVLKTNKIRPHIVLEQAIEKGSPHSMDAIKAHQLGLAYVKEVFVDFI